MPDVVIQYRGSEANVVALIEPAKAGFRSVKKRTRITDLKLYIKPKERAAYYADGKISFYIFGDKTLQPAYSEQRPGALDRGQGLQRTDAAYIQTEPKPLIISARKRLRNPPASIM